MGTRISGVELEIMKYLWKEEKVTFAELLNYFNEMKEKEWCKQTLNTHLLRLKNRGLLTKDKRRGSKTIYSPTVNAARYDQMCAEEVLKESYGGTLFNFLAALAGNNITDAEETELIDLIKKCK